ncbi:CRISPR-associated exonuclease Cas4 [Peptoniphilus koenoeneniae]|uniref:CRISPR-associated exonuclease Cas4 n=1 Tax=Peptoniphilus koenoeneniae TaxID=507751 RepID=A0ABU0AUH3_9FIRM|nr:MULTISPECIES: CRISPR-associated protein Cas4 [Peptoniphilus]ERT59075.1 CRISPR-associated protein Cas4 [Peptoniphilus sp. BV3C26]MDQ0274504.1 CRISPR-associated exonuclease Cas4 [Peptoniphilus koenoeneniae]
MNGTIINYYFHCKRQCYLFANKLNFEDNSELVKIGREIHEDKAINDENAEIKIENIAIDKITSKYITETKKSDADKEAAKWQLYYYLYVLKNKGIKRKGKLEFVENSCGKKIEYFELSEDIEKEILNLISKIELLIKSKEIPKFKKIKGCSKCAYYEYCKI